MKKIVFVLTAFLVCGFMISACSSDKKSKKSPSGITIELSTTTLGGITTVNSTHTISAVIKSNGVVQPDAKATWIVNPSDFGTFSPNPASTTTFTANTSKSGQGTITASYSGTTSSPITFAINQAPIVIDSVQISPSTPQSILSTETVTFTATAMAGTTTVTGVGTQINWTVTGGNVSQNPSNSGASVTFTPSGVGNATVQAKCGTVNSSVVSITVSDGVPEPAKFIVYNDEGLAADINHSAMVWTYPTGQEANPCAKMTEVSDDGASPDSQKSFKIVNDYAAQTNKACGWNFVLNTKMDLTGYTKLVFYAKGSTASDKILVEIGSPYNGDSGNTSATPFSATLTTSWTKYEIDITGLARNSIAVLANFVFAENRSVPNETIWIDYVYFE